MRVRQAAIAMQIRRLGDDSSNGENCQKKILTGQFVPVALSCPRQYSRHDNFDIDERMNRVPLVRERLQCKRVLCMLQHVVKMYRLRLINTTV